MKHNKKNKSLFEETLKEDLNCSELLSEKDLKRFEREEKLRELFISNLFQILGMAIGSGLVLLIVKVFG